MSKQLTLDFVTADPDFHRIWCKFYASLACDNYRRMNGNHMTETRFMVRQWLRGDGQ